MAVCKGEQEVEQSVQEQHKHRASAKGHPNLLVFFVAEPAQLMSAGTRFNSKMPSEATIRKYVTMRKTQDALEHSRFTCVLAEFWPLLLLKVREAERRAEVERNERARYEKQREARAAKKPAAAAPRATTPTPQD